MKDHSFEPDAPDKLEHLLSHPHAAWRALVDTLSTEEKYAMTTMLDIRVEHLSRLSGYLTGRMGESKADATHKASVDESNTTVRDVRKALGFFHYESNIAF
jgi:hypothetical protein